MKPLIIQNYYFYHRYTIVIRIIKLSLFMLFFVFTWLALEPPGGPNTPKKRDRKYLNTKRELKGELSDLPEDAYSTFERAVNFHIQDRYGEARREYGKLRMIQLPGGRVIDLTAVSRVVRHNLNLLRGKR